MNEFLQESCVKLLLPFLKEFPNKPLGGLPKKVLKPFTKKS